MQDRPTAIELLDALTDFMRDRSAHARDRWERFQFQVAATSMGIIRRELEMEDGFMRGEWRRLDGLLGSEAIPDEPAAFRARLRARNDELCERIRAGAFDAAAGEERLVGHLWETVVDKVRIASPREAP
jgi:hypothetical protein